MKAKKVAAIMVLVAIAYWSLFDQVSQGRNCKKSTSPDRAYKAELCLLDAENEGFYEYVARLFNAKGKLLAQHTFIANVVDSGINWVDADSDNGSAAYVIFTTGGDGGDDSAFINLPPSLRERILAMRPRLR